MGWNDRGDVGVSWILLLAFYDSHRYNYICPCIRTSRILFSMFITHTCIDLLV